VFRDADPEIVLVVRSVLPVFTHESERPERIGTCVLAKIDDHHFIVTAAHVVEAVHRATGRFVVAVGGELYAILRARFVTPSDHEADIGLIPVRSETAALLCQQGGEFLGSEMIDEVERAEGTDMLNALANAYVAVGFPASPHQSRINHRETKINAKSFSARLTLAPTTNYPEGLSFDNHLLLDFDLKGQSFNPPKLSGMSGGGL